MIKNKIKEISFFESFREIDKLLEKKCLKYNVYYKNHSIREVNQNCYWVDIIVSGSVVAYSLSESGNATNMFEFKEGSIIGANLILTEGKYPLTMYSKEKTEIISVNKCGIYELLHNYDFSINFFKALSINSQNLNRKVFKFHKKTIRENLLEYIHEQIIIQKSDTIKLPISKKQLADYFGIQRQSLFREFKNLQDEGIIDIDNRFITLL